jgi:predicted amino acid racemase
VFLDLLQRRNPAFLEAAAALHQAGRVPANSTVLDLDAIGRNTDRIANEARRLGLTAFAMTKQIGRNPDACAVIREHGITAAVGVDLECAVAAHAAGLRTGHLGHLVQVPRSRADDGIALRPDYWTVFSLDKAREVGRAAARSGRVQPVLARIVAEGDRFYRGHEGGFPAEDVVSVADALDAIEGVRFAGVTSFPTALFDAETGTVEATPNLRTLTAAKGALEASGRTRVELNAPGTTSTAMLAMLAEAGATQVEPGHGLTGTTPWHAAVDLVEEPAVAYVTEVSHVWAGEAFIFGGGLYVDPVLGRTRTRALVVPAGAGLSDAKLFDVDMPAPEAIDYYATIPLDGAPVRAGDTVLMGFRPQVFVSRSLTVGIAGVGGTPTARSAWASNGARPLGLADRTGDIR